MYEQQLDEELIERVKSGDEAAYRILFRRHYKDICYNAYKAYPDQHKAKDFAQEVFLDFWRRREVVNISSSLKSYLSRAVKYKAIDFIRAQKINFEENLVMKNEGHTNQHSAEYNELQDVIHNVVDKLPKRCKIIFSMSRFQQMSHGEIANELGISKKTIENQITKALKVLRQAVVQYQLQ